MALNAVSGTGTVPNACSGSDSLQQSATRTAVSSFYNFFDLGGTSSSRQIRTCNFRCTITWYQHPSSIRLPDPDDEEDGGIGISTIKASALPTIKAKPIIKPTVGSIEDFEDGFVLPTDLTHLPLAPLPTSHKASKTSLE